jgi:UDP-N-acetylglucosamine pyrophosphorylase/galactokinase/mevalonate kinase-like predicted kinase
MTNDLIETIVSKDSTLRNRSINTLLKGKKRDDLLKIAKELDEFRRSSKNLYHRVRASLFLSVIYRFYFISHEEIIHHGNIPFDGISAALDRDFENSLNIFLQELRNGNARNMALFSAIADSYYSIAFEYLLDQVKSSLSQCRENFHLFHMNSISDYPYSVPAEFMLPDPDTGRYPVGVDTSPVRLDPSHSGWSDIFFLGMDFPEGARVINLSVDLKIHGTDAPVLPPCECYSRFIEEPVIRLSSIDLNASKKIADIDELFNFGNDYLSLLKAGVVASGVIPPCFEKKGISLEDILFKLLNKKGGIEVVTRVNNIPKGSRLAVSTALLSTVITRLMRYSGQISNQTGPLKEEERRVVASRAILGEWLGGSGGGWQDSGGLWPGIKVITGKKAEKGNAEFGISNGCLLPEHNIFSRGEISQDGEKRIVDSLVLVHGGISQDVGPILEMVTEKYLLRYEKEWTARQKGILLFDKIVNALKAGNMKELGRLTTQDWQESIQQIIPWVNNAFTEELIERVRDEFREHYWGFLMLGGMSGGGMAFIVNPAIREKFKKRVAVIMCELKDFYASSFPFIIDPVVYDFELNREGISAHALQGRNAEIPDISQTRDKEKSCTVTCHTEKDEDVIKKLYGFDMQSHEYLKSLLKKTKIGLAENRLPEDTKIEDVRVDEILQFRDETGKEEYHLTGVEALKRNEVAVVTFAGGMGTRWAHGAAVVKPVNPFIWMEGRHRTFLEIHVAKSRKTAESYSCTLPHIFTTSYLTHDAVKNYLVRFDFFHYKESLYLSPAKTIAHRVYPMERDLRFFWEEQLQQKQNEHIQKVLDRQHAAFIEWARVRGQGEDYTENQPILRFNPPGHWYEIPNLIKNGVLAHIIGKNPNLKYLFCHNIDTAGAYIEPALLGMHIAEESCLTFEVIPKLIEDKGGGLAKINGHIQILEGLAFPRKEDEYMLSYYNTLTNWITIDSLLECFHLDRTMLEGNKTHSQQRRAISEAIRSVERKIPTYITLKNVKQLRSSGHEDLYPVAQFEKLWGDMSGLRNLKAGYVAVPRLRGQQLKEPSQLDRWFIDGSFEYARDKTCFKKNHKS